MKKLLIMASLFWPQKNSGGPPVSIMNLVKSIYSRYELYIISNNHELNDDKPLDGVSEGKNVFEFGTAYYLSREMHSIKGVLGIINQIQPDIIYQNSFFSYNDMIPVLLYKKAHRDTKVIITPRGEFQANALNKGIQKKMAYMRLLKFSGLLKDVVWQFAAESECENWKRVCKVSAKAVYIIPNLTYGGKVDLNRKKTEGIAKVCFVGRIHPHKNLLFALEVLSKIKGQVCFDIYGSCEDDAYYQECVRFCSTLPKNVECSFKGSVDNEYIHSVIGSYHALLLPTKSEAYGQSLVEAMLTAVPVITSNNTPWDDVNDCAAGYALDLDKKDAFVQALQCVVDMGYDEFGALTNRAFQYISGKLQTERTIREYENMFDL